MGVRGGWENLWGEKEVGAGSLEKTTEVGSPFPPKDPASFFFFFCPLLLSLHLTLVRCGERKGGPEKVEKERDGDRRE